MRSPITALFALLLWLLSSCGSGKESGESTMPLADRYVRRIQLSQNRGEVGKPFKAALTYESNFIRNPEVSMSGLPAELHYDEAQKNVVGTPSKPGFYKVQVAVRERVHQAALRRPRAE